MVRWERSESAGDRTSHRRGGDPVALAVVTCDAAKAVRDVSVRLHEEARRACDAARAARERARDLRTTAKPLPDGDSVR
ncbi:glycerol-3-phosphate acyltransferase PlsY [Amycolatopsis bartoniae]|uniref:Uncharacterized protein n=1 Tax=Amycolatopsis bartoniae TaxID=941986 RepID=A0A8H9IZ55_9PSEU|nr:hypothetical protein [Amycolatopsis bartoniae]MBB2937198.1 glycerol-3-phosphate acyltransferase PlsY [Amycolatopsis bartoniae]TVS99003.1 hypothetical protein FNH07_36080 [Amycolatopsis bartoniae]GHF53192.1 hypothetical protein GCM10017566_28220 [Amycolatopsis bartoniae]